MAVRDASLSVISRVAVCMRHCVRYVRGLSPMTCWKRAAKVDRDMPASFAMASTVHGCWGRSCNC
ncbi:hypothetical protein D7X32_00855 [Corallococcus carmarthensis]|uniref:Uncharacterized protein n=1 Tax=Corallococcus carmarthensis TaxID=2316728 RepID=A0A3A8KTU3_9BACT|nr:hypothetical protein D7X32_00855 [Corallococcus carmarthensis]